MRYYSLLLVGVASIVIASPITSSLADVGLLRREADPSACPDMFSGTAGLQAYCCSAQKSSGMELTPVNPKNCQQDIIHDVKACTASGYAVHCCTPYDPNVGMLCISAPEKVHIPNGSSSNLIPNLDASSSQTLGSDQAFLDPVNDPNAMVDVS